MIEDVLITSLDIIETPGGSVMHAVKNTSVGFDGFGEAYFSNIDFGAIKAWKRHKLMTLNLVVPIGKVKFVMFDDRNDKKGTFQEITVSEDNYCRVTVPPMIWMGFIGQSSNGSLIMNVANLQHDQNEVDKLNLNQIKYKWS
jgi:dTDP-4-dehydrorhamnose 3,5-epimerase